MTSEKVMLTVAVLLLGACAQQPKEAPPLAGPYGGHKLWAVAPLRNESGTLEVDGAALADDLSRQLENASHIDVLPVNRVIAAMELLGPQGLSDPRAADRLIELLNVDGLVVGTVSHYDPYDPPKLGMALELFVSERIRREHADAIDIQQLSRAATDGQATPRHTRPRAEPTSSVSGFYDAAAPDVRRKMQHYATNRDSMDWPNDDPIKRILIPQTDPHWHHYRISMDLYREFVSYAMARRLLEAESRRLTPLATNTAP
jgi:hypothetical protein